MMILYIYSGLYSINYMIGREVMVMRKDHADMTYNIQTT